MPKHIENTPKVFVDGMYRDLPAAATYDVNSQEIVQPKDNCPVMHLGKRAVQKIVFWGPEVARSKRARNDEIPHDLSYSA